MVFVDVILLPIAFLQSAVGAGCHRVREGVVSSFSNPLSRHTGIPVPTALDLSFVSDKTILGLTKESLTSLFSVVDYPTLFGGRKIFANQRKNVGEAA